MKKLGIIAGGGLLPRYIAEYCVGAKLPYFLLALEGFAEVDFIAQHPHQWQNMGKLGQAIDRLKDQGVTHLTFGGRVQRPSLSALKLDFTGMKLMGRLASLKNHGDDALLSTLMGFMEEQGFTIVSPDSLLTHLTLPTGHYAAAKPTTAQAEDIALGLALLKSLGGFDVGQAVVVQQKKLLAIEGAEGTEKLIERSATLALSGEKPVLVKIAKPEQDRRADMPAIGPDTLRQLHAAGFAGIAIQAGATLVLDKAACIELADQHHLFLEALHP